MAVDDHPHPANPTTALFQIPRCMCLRLFFQLLRRLAPKVARGAHPGIEVGIPPDTLIGAQILASAFGRPLNSSVARHLYISYIRYEVSFRICRGTREPASTATASSAICSLITGSGNAFTLMIILAPEPGLSLGGTSECPSQQNYGPPLNLKGGVGGGNCGGSHCIARERRVNNKFRRRFLAMAVAKSPSHRSARGLERRISL